MPAPVTTLVLPGIGNSGPQHWQSLWEAANPAFARIPQRSWDHPVCGEWRDTLDRSVADSGTNVVLVAHSLGCLLVAHWAASADRKIRGALLVAPPDPDGAAFPAVATGFSPLPLRRFAFPSILVASSNDPYGSMAFAKHAASSWGSRLVDIGPAGHINSESGLGKWSDGLSLLHQLAAEGVAS